MEKALHFTSEDVTSSALKAHGVVLADFWAPWCGPCRMVGPVVEQLAEEYAGRVTVGKVNIDEQEEAAKNYQVFSIPTLILFKDGVEVERMVGARGKAALVEMIEKHMP